MAEPVEVKATPVRPVAAQTGTAEPLEVNDAAVEPEPGQITLAEPAGENDAAVDPVPVKVPIGMANAMATTVFEPEPAGDVGFLVLLSDWQLGKGEGGGSAAASERIMAAIDLSLLRYNELRAAGRSVGCVYLIGLGDIVEGCEGYYPMQTYQADLSDREQDALARRLLLYAVNSFVDAGARVVAMGVPGNHGENRRNGKAFTDFRDNRDYSAFTTLADILAVNSERYSHVSVPVEALNDDDLTMTLEIFGVPVSFAHGHQFRSGANAQAKMEGWLKGQALGRTGVSDAQLLFAGHLHHFVISESTGRTVIQVPAMDGGSQWYKSTAGASAPTGMVSLVVGAAAGPRGWDDLKIL